MDWGKPMRVNAAEQTWERLVDESGPLVFAGTLRDVDLFTAMREQRIMLIEVELDGYGGGMVSMTLLDSGDRLLQALKHGSRPLHSWKLVVFAHPLHLSEAERQDLAQGSLGWEKWSEIPHLPS